MPALYRTTCLLSGFSNQATAAAVAAAAAATAAQVTLGGSSKHVCHVALLIRSHWCRSTEDLYLNSPISEAAAALWRLPLIYIIFNGIRFIVIFALRPLFKLFHRYTSTCHLSSPSVLYASCEHAHCLLLSLCIFAWSQICVLYAAVSHNFWLLYASNMLSCSAVMVKHTITAEQESA